MKELVTFVSVFGHTPTLARRWVEHHLPLLSQYKVILVENLRFPDPEVTAWLSYGVSKSKGNWRLLSTLPLLRNRKLWVMPGHGEGLDLAVRYVTTPFVLTMDSDAFIQDFSIVEEMVEEARNGASIVGFLNEVICLPYVFPLFALYRTELARRYKFEPRHLPEGLPEKYRSFWREEMIPYDPFWEARKRYLDVGQVIYLETLLQGGKVVHKNVFGKVSHQFGSTPFIRWQRWNGELFRDGRDGEHSSVLILWEDDPSSFSYEGGL